MWHAGEEKICTGFWYENLKGSYDVKYLDIDEILISKWLLKKWDERQ